MIFICIALFILSTIIAYVFIIYGNLNKTKKIVNEISLELKQNEGSEDIKKKYNENVRIYNNKIKIVPINIVAKIFRFKEIEEK